MVKSSSPSTVTYLSYLNGSIDILNLAKTLPVITLLKEETKEVIYYNCEGVKSNGQATKPRITLLFYGDEPDETFIISVRHPLHKRGIRRGGRCLNNTTAVDLQCCGKNIHIKVSKTKLTLIGVLSEEMGQIASQCMCDFINMTQTHINLLQAHKPLVFETLTLIKKNYPKFWDEGDGFTTQVEYKDGTDISDQIYNILISYLHDTDISSWSGYEAKIREFLEMSGVVNVHLAPSSYDICTKAYMYDMPVSKKPIYFNKLSLFLAQKDLHVEYKNNKPSDLLILYPSESQPNSTHSLNIHRAGKIRHNSPAGEEETSKVRDLILSYLTEFLSMDKSFNDYIQELKR